MVATDQIELQAEQDYFERAADARERKRANLGQAHTATAGPGKTVTAVKQAAERQVETLGDPHEAVAIGRFDLEDGEACYLGRHLIRDDDGEILVMNWQVRGAAPFYEATIADTRGLTRKRQFDTDRNRIKTFEDTIFADLAERIADLKDSELLGIDDAVLRDLQQRRDGEMSDIVQTIHAAQYELIRRPLEQLLIVQGGPGTGKTAVALHRVSWLLFNHREQLSADDVLVIGPNPTFTRYIRKVLPDLGDADIANQNLRSLGPEQSQILETDHDLAQLKGDSRMAQMIAAGLRQRVRFPERVDTIQVGPDRTGAVLSRAEVETEVRDSLTRASYNGGRGRFRSWLSNRVSDLASEPVAASQIDNALERVWPSLTSQLFLRELLGSRERLLTAAGDDFSASEVSLLHRPAQTRLSEERWTDADVALLDEADALINGPGRTFFHVVVDEAQDLTPMQLRSVRRRSRSGSMTIVGDLAQSTGVGARDSWSDVRDSLLQDHPASLAELELGYRVPAQIFEFAAQLLPLAAPSVTPPKVIRTGPTEPLLTEVVAAELADAAVAQARDYAGRGRFVGIVCPDSIRDEIVDVLRVADVQWSDTSTGNLGQSINVARPAEAKGLEFDAVVVVDPETIVAESERGHRMLYVALTRTTRDLAVIHTGVALPLTPAELEPLPPLPEPKVVAMPAAEPTQPGVADLSRVITRTAGQTLALELKRSVPQDLWVHVIDQLRRELGITDDQIFDLLGSE